MVPQPRDSPGTQQGQQRTGKEGGAPGALGGGSNGPGEQQMGKNVQKNEQTAKGARNALMGKQARNALIGKQAWPMAQEFASLLVQQVLGQFSGHFTGQFTWQFEQGSSLIFPEQPREAANRHLVWKDDMKCSFQPIPLAFPG